MELIPAFDPTSATSGSFIASTLQTGSQMIITNKSYVNLIFIFASGDQRPVLANDRRAFTFGGASSVPGPNIKWEQQSIDYPQTINQLENLVFVEIYAPTEIVTEKYPTVIQRETLPSLVPYNIGHGSYSLNIAGGTQTKFVIWPSSYPGITCAPKTNLQGFGFDHYWMSSDASVANPMIDIPGFFTQSTGKTENDASINNASLASYIPGPFSKPGLTPVDSATYLNSTYWQLANLIAWPANFYIDAWFMLPNIGGRQYFILSDDVVTLGINASGTLFAQLNYSGGSVFATTSTSITTNQWYHVALYVVGTNVLLWLNGTQVASTTATGTINTPVNHVKIGASNMVSNTFIGSITNIGILLSDITNGGWGQNAIQARYLLGQQSLNQDYQNAWINGLEINLYNSSASTSNMTQVILQNLFNPAGLLFGTTPSVFNALHRNLQAPGNLQWVLGQVATLSSSDLQATFYNPKTHYNSEFPYFNVQSYAGAGALPFITINVHGFNILGIK